MDLDGEYFISSGWETKRMHWRRNTLWNVGELTKIMYSQNKHAKLKVGFLVRQFPNISVCVTRWAISVSEDPNYEILSEILHTHRVETLDLGLDEKLNKESLWNGSKCHQIVMTLSP
jgi:hypothetical protein